jgi:hypothetical protein
MPDRCPSAARARWQAIQAARGPQRPRARRRLDADAVARGNAAAGAGYGAADNAYDVNELYKGVAAATGAPWVAPPRRPSAKGLGHRKHDPARLRSLALSANPLAVVGQRTSFGQDLLAARGEVAHEATSPCGLTHLPRRGSARHTVWRHGSRPR